MKVFVRGYSSKSMSVKELKNGLKEAGVPTNGIKVKGSNYIHNPKEHLVVNWGSSGCEVYDNMLNKPQAVSNATDKVSTFSILGVAGVSSLQTLTQGEAKKYLDNNKNSVIYCRTIVNGTKGKGIVVAKNSDELVPAGLYTKGITGERKELRLHVFQDKVIHIQEKKRRNGFKDNNKFSDDVRNLNGGWVFAINNINAHNNTKSNCIKAVNALGLDFGAVDVIELPNGKNYVVEVNTACGLHGTTITRYVEAIKDYIGG